MKKTIKKVSMLALTAALALAFTACDDEPKGTTSSKAASVAKKELPAKSDTPEMAAMKCARAYMTLDWEAIIKLTPKNNQERIAKEAAETEEMLKKQSAENPVIAKTIAKEMDDLKTAVKATTFKVFETMTDPASGNIIVGLEYSLKGKPHKGVALLEKEDGDWKCFFKGK